MTDSLARATRNDLLAIGIPLVRRLAYRVARRVPASVDVNDLMGAGAEGLLKAVIGYDPHKSDRFEPYAESRIRGAILDELRAVDVMTRHGRRREAEVERTGVDLQRSLGRPPSEDEIAGKLGIGVDELRALTATLARGPALGRSGEIDPDTTADEGGDPQVLLIAAEERARLASAIAALPARMQEVLSLYYQHERTQADIGRVLGVTESRVCQILGQAASRLREALVENERPSAHAA